MQRDTMTSSASDLQINHQSAGSEQIMPDQGRQDVAEITYFIDESGNTGDLTLGGESLSFGGQPYFGLGCLGVRNMVEFNNDITELKAKHRIQTNDLKSTKIYKGKPKFILDLVKLIKDKKIPFFVELTEKKYFIATNLVFYLVCPPYFRGGESQKLNFIRNVFSQFLTKHAPNEVFKSYFDACNSQSKEGLLMAFETLLRFAHSGSTELHRSLVTSVTTAMEDFQIMLTQEPSETEAVRRFLPLPDTGKKGKEVWILPNYSSLTNIYARINYAHDGNIERVKIVHDVQTQFDDILFSAKEAAESATVTREVSPTTNYRFLEQAEMSIGRSEESLGIQAADILTGFLVRYAQDIVIHKVDPAPELVAAFYLLALAEQYSNGYGVNYVWSHNDLTAPV
ncbi:DUF3800 domain-containing protein [Pseudomonas sp. yb_9]|uniref:DUF3800 domain-containing protein n=1 Tax=Pseudomonas sp. yb_9 TaxID=3367222 RepID=UPI00370CA883